MPVPPEGVEGKGPGPISMWEWLAFPANVRTGTRGLNPPAPLPAAIAKHAAVTGLPLAVAPAQTLALRRRYVPSFGHTQYRVDRAQAHEDTARAAGAPVAGFEEQVAAVHRLMQQGKVRPEGEVPH